MGTETNEPLTEAAKVIDPDAWLSQTDFRREYGGFPGWDAGSQAQRQRIALQKARGVAAVLVNASDKTTAVPADRAAHHPGCMRGPSVADCEAFARWLHMRFGRNQPREWDSLSDRLQMAWRDLASDAPAPCAGRGAVYEPVDDYPDAEGLAALRTARDGSDPAGPASLVGKHATTRLSELVEIIESVALPQRALWTHEAELIADAICARSECLHLTSSGMTSDVTADRLYVALRDAGEGRATSETLSRKLARSLAIQASEETIEAPSEDARVLLALNATIVPDLAAPDLSSWDAEVVERMRAALRAADGAVAKP